MKCGQSATVKCTSLCERQLNCGKHFCKAVCHAGPCEKCEETVQQGKSIVSASISPLHKKG